MMNVLHIASISGDPCSGVSVAVPAHVNSQGAFANTALLNIAGKAIDSVDMQISGSEWSYDRVAEEFGLVDLVVFHEVYRPPYLAIAKDLKKRGIPYVVLPHGEISTKAQEKKWLKKKLANIVLFGRFVKGAAAVQCLSSQEQETLVFSTRSFIGTNGVSMPLGRKSAFRTEGRKLVYIGRLDAFHKGLDLLIEAIGSMQEELRATKSKMYIYGPDFNGRYDNVVGLVNDAGVADLVEVQLAILGEKKKQTLLDADGFIQTSRFEGMPLGILEAMSYGVPCLVSKGTNLSQEITEAGAGFDCDSDAGGITTAIRQFSSLSPEKLEEMSRNAIALVRDKYSWPCVANAAVGEYEKLINDDSYKRA